jgi:hypothetical protein
MTNPISQKSTQHTESTDLAPLTIIRTETVLSRLPIHNLKKKGRVDIRIVKKNTQGEINLQWEVSYSERHGQPRQIAYKLDTIVINQKIDAAGRPLPKIICLGSLRDIARELGLGGDTNNIKKALRQNAFTGITAKVFYKATDGTEKWLEADFTRYSIVFTGEKLPNRQKADAVYLILNDPYWEVLNSVPTRPLDYHYLKSLTPAAQRFYEIVSYKIFAAIKFRHADAKLAYSEYCIFSAQQRYHEYDRVKKQMYKVHRPHIQSQYLKRVTFSATVDEHGEPDWIMHYVPGEKAYAEYQFFTNKKQRARIATAKLDDGATHMHAVELVGYFYQRFHQQEVISPNSKEIEQATELTTRYGNERARFIVDFSFAEAQDTNYLPKFFGGILQYVPRALARFDQRENARRKEDSQKQHERLQEAYEAYKEGEIERMRSRISPEELSVMESSIRAELEAEGTLPALIGVGVSIRVHAQLEDRASILPFEEWKKQKRRSSKGQTAG